MASAQEQLKELLKAQHRSVTKARLAVFTSLLQHEPVSMHDLVARTPSIDRASVYRAVELFERLGIVQRLHTGWKYKLELSDAFTEHHHHLTCQRCGRTYSMNEDELEQVIARLSTAHGFTPTSHQIEIQGFCKNCQ